MGMITIRGNGKRRETKETKESEKERKMQEKNMRKHWKTKTTQHMVWNNESNTKIQVVFICDNHSISHVGCVGSFTQYSVCPHYYVIYVYLNSLPCGYSPA